MNDKDLRDVLAIMILNGMLSRLPSEEIDPANVWYLADAMIESRDAKPIGLPPIKRRKKSES
jgi:hypothetical protein